MAGAFLLPRVSGGRLFSAPELLALLPAIMLTLWLCITIPANNANTSILMAIVALLACYGMSGSAIKNTARHARGCAVKTNNGNLCGCVATKQREKNVSLATMRSNMGSLLPEGVTITQIAPHLLSNGIAKIAVSLCDVLSWTVSLFVAATDRHITKLAYMTLSSAATVGGVSDSPRRCDTGSGRRTSAGRHATGGAALALAARRKLPSGGLLGIVYLSCYRPAASLLLPCLPTGGISRAPLAAHRKTGKVILLLTWIFAAVFTVVGGNALLSAQQTAGYYLLSYAFVAAVSVWCGLGLANALLALERHYSEAQRQSWPPPENHNE